jgi:Xaa-Pro aminopeptidase
MEYVERHIENFRSVLSSTGLDAILLANFRVFVPTHYNYNLYYISNILGFFPICLLILTEDDCRVWVDTGDVANIFPISRAIGQSWLEKIEPIAVEGSLEEFARIAAKNLREMTGKKIIKVGVDGRQMPSSITLSLIKEGLQIEDASLALEKSRLILDEGELKLLRKAAEISDKGVEKVMDKIEEGITERELSVIAEYEMRRQGAECFWWPSIIASGPEAEFFADSPNDREIRKGDLLWMDFTPVYKGYAGDIARAFIYGEASKEQLTVWNLAKEALDEGASSLTEGVNIRQVMMAAAEPVRGSPYEKFYSGAGHGIGLFNDVYPSFLKSTSKMKTMSKSLAELKLAEGMTIAVEIVFTVPGLGGIRLEDDYLITTKQPEQLTKAPIMAILE